MSTSKSEVVVFVCGLSLFTVIFIMLGTTVIAESQRLAREENEMNSRDKLNNTMCLEDVPEAYHSKWLADPSKFEGLDEFARTVKVERYEVIRYERSRVAMERVSETEMSLRVIFPHSLHSIDVKLGGECVYRSEESNYIVYMENGNLNVETAYFSNQGKKNFVTRVYRIEDTDLI